MEKDDQNLNINFQREIQYQKLNYKLELFETCLNELGNRSTYIRIIQKLSIYRHCFNASRSQLTPI
jgi:hypothetical protein